MRRLFSVSSLNRSCVKKFRGSMCHSYPRTAFRIR